MRADGKRVKNVEPMYAIIPHIMDKRYDAMNCVTVHLPYLPIHNYLLNARKQGQRLSHMALIIAAYLRCAAEFPLLNRFIMNKRIYSRNDFTVSMVVLRPGDMDGTMTKVRFELTDTLQDVNRKILEFIETNKAGENTNSTDRLMKRLLGIPGLLRSGVNVLKFLDRHNLMPRAVIDASPFHCSLVISNLASIRTNHIYHHCYEFGTSSVFITIGNSIEKPEYNAQGAVELHRYIPCGVVMDERICSGSYFARVFRRLQQYINDPSLLEVPPQEVVQDF